MKRFLFSFVSLFSFCYAKKWRGLGPLSPGPPCVVGPDQTIRTYILPNISQSRDDQTLKFGELVEYNKRNNFFKNHAENEAGKLVPDFFLFFRKTLYEVKVNGLELRFNHF